jgi:hypothetical protein
MPWRGTGGRHHRQAEGLSRITVAECLACRT